MAIFAKTINKIAIDYASMIKSEIYGEEYYRNFADYFHIDEHILDIALKPQKWTLLHDYIADSTLSYIRYLLKKAGSDIYEDIYSEFDAFQCPYKRHETYHGTDFHDYLAKAYRLLITPTLTYNIFGILFADRETMRQFNTVIAKEISSLTYSNHPKHLKKDGTMKRCTYWPSWLTSALIRRDQGHCAICQKDLTGLLSNGNNIAIDHIVPLNLGGTNDPTNLQILCNGCNSQKGGDSADTSDMYSPFW